MFRINFGKESSLAERIGDLVVLGDKDTMFGETASALEELPGTYRAHGSVYEMDLPLIAYDPSGELPPAPTFQWNKDLTHFLYS
jgi:phosphonoacetate hydrolase